MRDRRWGDLWKHETLSERNVTVPEAVQMSWVSPDERGRWNADEIRRSRERRVERG